MRIYKRERETPFVSIKQLAGRLNTRRPASNVHVQRYRTEKECELAPAPLDVSVE
jgi:hypothetical protein